jgi:hypothetical protein
MNASFFFSIPGAISLAIVSTATNAELFDRGSGLIYDSVQDLTWTQDAGMSGSLNWDEAMAWAANLEFGGFDDWRLPATTQFDDPTCSADVRAAGVYALFYEHRLDCRGGEMELLTYLHDPRTNPLFINVNATRYWTDTPYRDWIDPCIDYPAYDVPCTIRNDSGIRTDFYWQWGFTGFDGINGPAYKTTLRGTNNRYAWAVRDGDIGLINGPVDLSGTVKASGGEDLCAMVLASGQFMFSCNPAGVFSLEGLPRENSGSVKRQIYADGFFPKVDTLTGSSNDAVVMTRSGTCPSYNTPYDTGFFPDSAGKRINISGKVLTPNSQTPICAMVLANGQYMFSCDGSGSYALNIPLDTNGQFKLQVYADGFAPTIQTFDEFKTTNNVTMAPAGECQ